MTSNDNAASTAEKDSGETYLGKIARLTGLGGGSSESGPATSTTEGTARQDTGDDVAAATYTARSYHLDSGKTEEGPPSTLQASAASQQNTPHLPGEFPTETGEDPHSPDTSTGGTSQQSGGVASGSTAATGLGATATGAGLAATESSEPLAQKSTDEPATSTERDLHPGGTGFPYESSQQSTEQTVPATSTDKGEDNTARNAALGAAGLGAAGAAGYGAYSATQDDKPDAAANTSNVGSSKPEAIDHGQGGPLNSHKHDPNVTGASTEPGDSARQAARAASNPATDNVPTANESKEQDDNMARNAALAAAGATGVGAGTAYGLSNRDETTPSSATTDNVGSSQPGIVDHGSGGPLDSHKHDPEKTTTSTALDSGTSPTAPVSSTTDPVETEPKQDDDHTSRNAALAGAGVVGSGAAGYGIYEATKDDVKPEQTSSSVEPTRDVTAPPSSTTATTTPSQPATSTSEPIKPAEEANTEDDHTGRNAALAGTGAAGAGAGAYALHDANKDDAAEPEQKKSTMQKLKEKLKGDKSKDEKSTTGEQKPLDEPKEEEDHTARNAALGAAGAGAAGAGAYGVYEASKDDKAEEAERLQEQERQREQAEQARKEQEKQAEKARKEQEKEAEKARKEQEKKAEKERHEQEKAAQKEKEKAEKARKEEEKRAEKARKDEEERQQKERAAAIAAEDERKKKEEAERKKLEDEERLRQEEEERKRKEDEESHFGRDAAIGGAAAAPIAGMGYAAHEYGKDDEEKSAAEKLAEYEAQRDVEPKKGPIEKIKSAVSSNKHDETKTEEEEDDSHTGRDAALVGGGAAAAGGTAYAAHEATKDPNDPTVASDTSKPETTSQDRTQQPQAQTTRDPVLMGGDAAATQPTHEETQSHGRRSYEDPNLTQAERLHEYERVRAEREGRLHDNKVSTDSKGHHHLHKKGADQDGEKKPSLIHRILHPGESRKSSDGSDPSTTPRQGSAPPPEENEGYVTMVNPNAPSDAPHLTVRDHPEDSK